MRTMLTALCVVTLAACGGGDKSDSAVADSLSRDLQLAQQDSTNPMADTAGTPAAAPVAVTTAATPSTSRSPRPRPRPPSRSPPHPRPTLASGATFSATVPDTVSSRTTKSGAMMQAKVGTDVMSEDGRLVIPAGSTVNIRLDEFKSAPTKGGKETFSASLVSVIIDGTSYPISGNGRSSRLHAEGAGHHGGDRWQGRRRRRCGRDPRQGDRRQLERVPSSVARSVRPAAPWSPMKPATRTSLSFPVPRSP